MCHRMGGACACVRGRAIEAVRSRTVGRGAGTSGLTSPPRRGGGWPLLRGLLLFVVRHPRYPHSPDSSWPMLGVPRTSANLRGVLRAVV